jgi:transmembrane sensor
MDFRHPFRRKPGGAAMLDSTLEAEAARLHDADPETELRWKHLQNLLAGPEGVEARAAAKFRLRPALAYGLAVAAVAATGVLLLRPAAGDVSYATGKGELSRVVLTDSSEVTLNHTSRLVVDRQSGRKGRYVELEGEAFFRVRSTGEPFVVETRAGTVRVLGTEFNVRVRGDRLEVAVVGGRVRVVGTTEVSDEITLPAGTMISCERGRSLPAPEKILFADYPGWIHQKLLFQRADFRTVLSEIEARFGVTVRVENPALLNETITGALDSKSAGAAVATLATLTGSSYRHEADGFALY